MEGLPATRRAAAGAQRTRAAFPSLAAPVSLNHAYPAGGQSNSQTHGLRKRARAMPRTTVRAEMPGNGRTGSSDISPGSSPTTDAAILLGSTFFPESSAKLVKQAVEAERFRLAVTWPTGSRMREGIPARSGWFAVSLVVLLVLKSEKRDTAELLGGQGMGDAQDGEMNEEGAMRSTGLSRALAVAARQVRSQSQSEANAFLFKDLARQQRASLVHSAQRSRKRLERFLNDNGAAWGGGVIHGGSGGEHRPVFGGRDDYVDLKTHVHLSTSLVGSRARRRAKLRALLDSNGVSFPAPTHTRHAHASS